MDPQLRVHFHHLLRIIHVFTIESHDVVEHSLGLHGRTVRVKLYSPDVAVNGFVPLALLTVFVTFLIILLSCHLTQ